MMIKINILFGIMMLFLTTIDAQDDTILMHFPIGHCAINSIPLEYVDKSLYACANASINEESTFILFSMEGLVNPVNRISMALERNSSFGCFTYFPKRQQFKMCFNAFNPPTTNTQFIHPNDKQEISITRGIYYGNISNFDMGIDEKIWPVPSSIPGYFQNDFQHTKVYHANRGDKIFISYEIEEKPGYIIKLTVQDENEKSRKWEEYNKNYIINEELISGHRLSVEFFVINELHYRVFLYTFIKNDIVDPSPLDFSVKIIRYPASNPNLHITEGFYSRKFGEHVSFPKSINPLDLL